MAVAALGAELLIDLRLVLLLQRRQLAAEHIRRCQVDVVPRLDEEQGDLGVSHRLDQHVLQRRRVGPGDRRSGKADASCGPIASLPHGSVANVSQNGPGVPL